MSKYSPSGYIAREAGRIVRITTVPPNAPEVRKVEFWRYAALTMAYAKSDPTFAATCLKELRSWARMVAAPAPAPEIAYAARAYSTLHTRG